jgi:hypothetical protein
MSNKAMFADTAGFEVFRSLEMFCSLKLKTHLGTVFTLSYSDGINMKPKLET